MKVHCANMSDSMECVNDQQDSSQGLGKTCGITNDGFSGDVDVEAGVLPVKSHLTLPQPQYSDTKHQTNKNSAKTAGPEMNIPSILTQHFYTPDDGLFLSFAKNTSFHGFNKVANAQTKAKRIAWIIAIIIAFGTLVAIISHRTAKYFRYDTVTETKSEYSPNLTFPAVTICNYNAILKSNLVFEIIALPIEPIQDSNDTGDSDVLLNQGGPSFAIIDPIIARLQEQCSFTSCSGTELRCPTTSEGCCLSSELICNGFFDCLDETDEENCDYDTEESRKRRDFDPITTTTSAGPLSLDTPADLIPIETDLVTDSAPQTGKIPIEVDNKTFEILQTSPDIINAETTTIILSKFVPTEGPEGVRADLTLFEDIAANGWQLKDRNFDNPDETTLLSCVFSKNYCDTKWFKKSVTELGNCFTFNSADLLEDITNLPQPLMQEIAGPIGGFLMKVDIQQYEYSTNNPFVGAKVLIHHPDSHPDTSQEGINIGVGQQADIALHYTRYDLNTLGVTNLHAPWGKCDPERNLKLSTAPYTFEACASECKITKVLEECKCRPYFYTSADYLSYNNTMWYGCAVPAMAEVDTNFETICDCPASCYSHQYSPQVSYLPFTNYQYTTQNLNTRFYGTPDGRSNYNSYPDNTFYQQNIVGLRVYYRNMMKTSIREMKALDEIGLLSEIGGQLGLFVGVSILTVCEILETMLLACMRSRAQKNGV